MKTKEELEKLIWDNYNSKAPTNPREGRLIAVFTANNMPQIAVTETQRGNDLLTGARPAVSINLSDFHSQLTDLKKDEFFVLGRLPECDHRPGLADLAQSFLKDGKTAANAESFYMRHAVTISRIHCFVRNNQDGTFSLFDCSVAGTCVMMTEKKPF